MSVPESDRLPYYPTSCTSADTWAIDIDSICVDVNAFPWVVVKLLISVVVSPVIALTLSAGMPVVLVSEMKLLVLNPAT